MSPLMWLSLNLYFLILLMMLMILLYFFKKFNYIKSMNNKIFKIYFNVKW